MLKLSVTLLASALLSVGLPAEIKFITGPATDTVGDHAEIKVPDGWSFVPQESMKEFNEAAQNLYSPEELGALLSPKGMKDGFWAFFSV